MVNFGGSLTLASGNGPVQLIHANSGLNDLVAYMKPAAPGGSADRGFISRALNPGNGGSVGTIDFTGANSFGPAAANGSVTGMIGAESLTQSMHYYTGTGANACTAATLYNGGTITAGSFIAYGVPSPNQVATDFHSIFINAMTGITLARGFQEDFHSMTRLATPFMLPSQIPVPSMTTNPHRTSGWT
jgi:hypothetical protein